jgi:hypothetical protein
MRFLLLRLSEGSSWAGIAAALGTLGAQLPSPVSAAALTAAAFSAIAAVLLKDPGAPDRPANR